MVEDGQVKKVYTVAVGKPTTPSPVGTFTIQRRVKNPTYQHDGKTVLPGPGNPVGTRWMGLSMKGYGIHGTNEPKSIGKAASHGCIRMARKDLEEMYEMVSVGDTVELVGQRNEETAQLFGEQKPVVASRPVMTASIRRVRRPDDEFRGAHEAVWRFGRTVRGCGDESAGGCDEWVGSSAVAGSGGAAV